MTTVTTIEEPGVNDYGMFAEFKHKLKRGDITKREILEHIKVIQDVYKNRKITKSDLKYRIYKSIKEALEN